MACTHFKQRKPSRADTNTFRWWRETGKHPAVAVHYRLEKIVGTRVLGFGISIPYAPIQKMDLRKFCAERLKQARALLRAAVEAEAANIRLTTQQAR